MAYTTHPLQSSFKLFVDAHDLSDELVFIPASAIEHIETRVRDSGMTQVFYFEVIEFFFEWLAQQDRCTQKDILRAGLLNGKNQFKDG